jgi:hypothetical protein
MPRRSKIEVKLTKAIQQLGEACLSSDGETACISMIVIQYAVDDLTEFINLNGLADSILLAEALVCRLVPHFCTSPMATEILQKTEEALLSATHAPDFLAALAGIAAGVNGKQ